MIDCWSVLELNNDADERSIKRQYARLLKVNRPDEDPAAFQNLRDAYEEALQLARSRADEDEPPVMLRQPLPEPSPAPLLTTTVIEQPDGMDWLQQVRQTTAQNLPEQQQIAMEHGQAERFQQLLLLECLNDSRAVSS
ncbi:hypothetical protein IBA8402_06680 [Pseudomonas syringae]